MKTKSRQTVFGYLLLGLIQKRSQSGYSIRQALKVMPIMHFTDSPGSVYPALKKLELAELIVGKKEGSQLRPRKVYAITKAGNKVLQDWIRSPFDKDELLRHPDSLFVRLSFSDKYLSDDELACLVQSVQAVVSPLEAELRDFHKSAGPIMERGGNMATSLALEILGSYIRWAKKALK